MKKLLYGTRLVAQNYPLIDMIANLRQYQFMDRDQPVGNQDYGDVDNCPAKAPSRAHTSSVTRVPETDYAHTEIGETVHAAELVGGLFH